MFKKSKVILGKTFPDQDYGNELVPTLDRQRKYVEFFGGWVSFGKTCLLIAILSLISTIISITWSITVQKGITKEVQVVLADSIGRLTPVTSEATDVRNLRKDSQYVASELARYIIGLRTISPDISVMKQLYTKSKRMTSPDLQAKIRNLVEEHLTGVQEGTPVQPIIMKVNPFPSGTSWSVEWREVTGGDEASATYWSAIINIDFFKPTDPDVIWNDPLGILIKGLTIQQANYLQK